MAVVYQHRRLDTNEIFYVGIELDTEKQKAKGYRSKVKNKRSNLWKNITSKTEYNIEIVCNDVDNKTAKQIETYLIYYYGRRDLGLGNLANHTNGGEGITGYKFTKESRDKRSESRKGFKHSQSTKNKIGKIHLGRKRPLETCDKISKANGRKIINTETNEIFNSIKDAANSINMKYSTLIWVLRKSLNNKTPFQYINK